MKLFLSLIILMSLSCSNSEGSKKKFNIEEFKEKRSATTHSLKIGDCFRSERISKPDYSFQKEHVSISNIYVVIYKDRDALLIAQPNPICEQPSDESHKCSYWFRDMSYNSPFLMLGDEKIIRCPKNLNRKILIERLEKSPTAKEYNMKLIKSK